MQHHASSGLPELLRLKEVSAHTHDELFVIGLQHQHLAINGVLPPFAGENDPLAQSILAREEKALQAMPDNLANLPCLAAVSEAI